MLNEITKRDIFINKIIDLIIKNCFKNILGKENFEYDKNNILLEYINSVEGLMDILKNNKITKFNCYKIKQDIELESNELDNRCLKQLRQIESLRIYPKLK